MVVVLAGGPAEPNYAAVMADWRTERVRRAEEALDEAAQAAEEILSSIAPRPVPEPEPEHSVLRDAW
jgi:hypothetical protein